MATEAFRGEFYQKVDGKARVSIPAAFRRILDAADPASAEFPRTRMIMVYGGKNRSFVECYSRAGADELARQVEAIPMGSRQRDDAVHADEVRICQPDRRGELRHASQPLRCHLPPRIAEGRA